MYYSVKKKEVSSKRETEIVNFRNHTHMHTNRNSNRMNLNRLEPTYLTIKQFKPLIVGVKKVCKGDKIVEEKQNLI